MKKNAFLLLIFIVQQVTAQRLDASKVFLIMNVTPSGFIFTYSKTPFKLVYKNNGITTTLPINAAYVNGSKTGSYIDGKIEGTNYIAPDDMNIRNYQPITISAETIDKSGQKILVFKKIYIMKSKLFFEKIETSLVELKGQYYYKKVDRCKGFFLVMPNGDIYYSDAIYTQDIEHFVNNVQGACAWTYTQHDNPEPHIHNITGKLLLENGNIVFKNCKIDYEPGAEIGLTYTCRAEADHVISQEEPYKPTNNGLAPLDFRKPLNKWTVTVEGTKYRWFYEDSAIGGSYINEFFIDSDNYYSL